MTKLVRVLAVFLSLLYVVGECAKRFEQWARRLRSPGLARKAGEAAQRLSLRG